MSAEAPKDPGEAPPRVVQIPQKPLGDVSCPEAVPTSRDVVVEDEHPNTDGRQKLEWQSRYPAKACTQMYWEGGYVAVVLALALAAIFLTWRGSAFSLLAGDCSACSRTTFDRYAYFCLGGLFGGTLFGLKYLYNAAARGWWNVDRRLWRLLSPFLSAGLALAVGALMDSGVLGLTIKATSSAAYLSMGFITGYFADSALRKMKEIADTVFGSPEEHSGHSTRLK